MIRPWGLRHLLAGVTLFLGTGALAITTAAFSTDDRNWLFAASALLTLAAVVGLTAAVTARPPQLRRAPGTEESAPPVLTIIALSAVISGTTVLAAGLWLLAVACYVAAGACLVGVLKDTLGRSSAE
jgi:tellurite resistance protein TehA-like permease